VIQDVALLGHEVEFEILHTLHDKRLLVLFSWNLLFRAILGFVPIFKHLTEPFKVLKILVKRRIQALVLDVEEVKLVGVIGYLSEQFFNFEFWGSRFL
jgi:hypothetical protein